MKSSVNTSHSYSAKNFNRIVHIMNNTIMTNNFITQTHASNYAAEKFRIAMPVYRNLMYCAVMQSLTTNKHDVYIH